MKLILWILRLLTKNKHPHQYVVLEYDPHPRMEGQWVGPSPYYEDLGREVRWMPEPKDNKK